MIGIFDIIQASAFPFVHAQLSIALRLRGQAHEIVPLKVELARPNGEVLITLQHDFTVSTDGSAFIHLNLTNTQFPDAGRYVVKVTSAGQVLTSHSLQVQKLQAPPQAGPEGGSRKLH